MVDILDPTKVGGADVSSYESSPNLSTGSGINWNTMVKAGAKFMYTRVSIGLNNDGAFSKIWSELKGLLPRGGYHFLYPSSTGLSIRQQANLFASLLKPDPGEMPPCVDVEYQGTDSKNQPVVLTSADVFGFITYLHEALSPWPWKDDVLIYTGYYYWKDTIASTDSSWLAHKLWIAGYQVTQPAIPPPWTNWFLWQWTSNGDGETYGTVSKSVDLNYFNGTATDFANYIAGVFQPNPTPAPTPPPTPTPTPTPTPVPTPTPTPTVSAYYQVTPAALNIRSGPGTTNPVIGTLLQNAVVGGLALSADGGWIEIRRSDGLIGWCSAAYLTAYSGPVPTPAPTTVKAYYQVTATALNIRSGPGTTNPVIGTLLQNAIVSGLTLSADGGWIEIRRSDGLIGWCSAAYLTPYNQPVPTPTPTLDPTPTPMPSPVPTPTPTPTPIPVPTPIPNPPSGYVLSAETGPRNTTLHVLQIDPKQAKFFVSPQAGLLKTSDALVKYVLKACWNGDGFSATTQLPLGTWASEGQVIQKNNVEDTLYIDKNNVFTIYPRPSILWNAVSFPNRLITDGVINTGLEATSITPRTAFGWNGTNVYVVVCDGNEKTEIGMTKPEIANYMLALGCVQAVNFDGGGSSALAIQGQGLVSAPNDEGQERAVANHVGFFIANPSPTPTPSPTPAPTPTPTPSPAPNGTITQLSFYPNIETIGVVASGVNLPSTAQLMYRQDENAPWQTGHPLMQIPDGRLVGSLFNLSPSTKYFIQVSNGTNQITDSTATQPDELQFTPSTILYVDSKAAAGGNGSSSAPFQKIQDAVNHASAGTQVLVADGTYTENVTFLASGTANNWIQVKAAGSAAILDGSKGLIGQTWNAMSGINKVWYLKLGSDIAYLARDGQRFYNYDSLGWLEKSLGHNYLPNNPTPQINEGWYYESSTKTLYVRSLDDPSHHSWQVPIINHTFDITAQDCIWIEGFEMRYYGTQLDGCGVRTHNASHIVIRNNKIHNLQLGIFVDWNGTDSQGNDTRIENNEIYDPPVDQWPWAAVKGSSMEGEGIVMRGHIGGIVRGNEIHNINNGIYTGSDAADAVQNPDVAFDLDIYNNHIHNIGDDSQEPEGACVNHRFRNNIIDTSLTGVSIGPVTQGPTWVIRCLWTNILGTSIKWADNPAGHVLIYHNTSYISAPGLNAMSTITPMQNSVMRNNIFQGNAFAFEASFTGAKNNDWNYDNWYTTRGTSGPHFMWEDISYQTIAQLSAATGLERNGFENPPGFVNPSGGNFTLLPTSSEH